MPNHSYVVASIEHTDSNNREVDFSKNLVAGFPSTLYKRARDQQFSLDYLNTASSPFWSRISAESAAVIGYSMGDYNFSPKVLAGLGFSEQSRQTFLVVVPLDEMASPHAGKRWFDLRHGAASKRRLNLILWLIPQFQSCFLSAIKMM